MDGTIRVCVVAPVYMTGGQAIEAQALRSGFARDETVRIDVQPIDPPLPSWLAGIPWLRTIARLPLYFSGLVRRVLAADVVHVFTAGFWPFLVTTTPAVLIGRAFGRPVILNYRDGRAADHIGSWWVGWVLRRATLLVFPSGFLRDVFRKFGHDGVVVPNVVDTKRFRFRRRTPLRPVLLSCRLLEELYAVENTIRAFRIVLEHHPEASLVIVGDGDQRPRLEELVRSESIDHVHFVGAVPHEAMADWFDQADILVNSSRIDNMPHSLIEAFAAGMPVVTTPAGGIPYVVEDGRNGLYAAIDDPASMAAAVLRLLQEPGLADRLVDEGQCDCVERYSWNAAQAEWSALYGSLTGGVTQRASRSAVDETSDSTGVPIEL